MGELERLKDSKWRLDADYPVGLSDSYKAGWNSCAQAAWDAGWRPVPSEEEIFDWLLRRDTQFFMIGGRASYELRQWLLERGE